MCSVSKSMLKTHHDLAHQNLFFYTASAINKHKTNKIPPGKGWSYDLNPCSPESRAKLITNVYQAPKYCDNIASLCLLSTLNFSSGLVYIIMTGCTGGMPWEQAEISEAGTLPV